jgi:hypothetical protein
MAMCVGILIIALPVGIVGSKFQEAYKAIPRTLDAAAFGAEAKTESPQASAKPSSAVVPEEVNLSQSGGSSASPVARASPGALSEAAAGSGEPPTIPSRTTTPAAKETKAEPEGWEFVDLHAWIASLEAVGHTVSGSRAHVDKLVLTYDRLTEVAAQVACAQREYMLVQQELGYEMDHLLSARRRNPSGPD